jgi:hypothetical protein
MSSYSRNTRRVTSLLRLRALGAVLALTLVSGAALAAGAHRFVFMAYSDEAGGADVVAGRYRVALEKLKADPGAVDFDPWASNTNRCVAYSMTLQWQEARAACDAAVRAAEERRNSMPSWMSWNRGSFDDELALAYANRAVLHWLSHDEAGAQKDLANAQALSSQADFVARNVAALKVHVTTVALTAVPAPKS